MEFFLSLNLSFHFPPLLSLFFLFPSNHLFIFLSLDSDTKILSVLSVLFLPCSFIRADNIRYVFTRLQVQLFLSYPGIQATSIFCHITACYPGDYQTSSYLFNYHLCSVCFTRKQHSSNAKNHPKNKERKKKIIPCSTPWLRGLWCTSLMTTNWQFN